jgi:hypothetical protein
LGQLSGTRIEAPIGSGVKGRDRLPNRLRVCGSVVSSLSGVRGRSPVANDFGAFYDVVPKERRWWIPGRSHFCVSALYNSHVIMSAAAGFHQAIGCPRPYVSFSNNNYNTKIYIACLDGVLSPQIFTSRPTFPPLSQGEESPSKGTSPLHPWQTSST